MFRKRRFSRSPEDPSVARVEGILATVASRCQGSAPQQEGRPRAARALWICACVTPDDAPIWLIFDTDDGDVAWCRVADRVEPADLVDAKLIAGGHADPSEALRWLQGATPDPWGGGGSGGGDESVVRELGSKIRRS